MAFSFSRTITVNTGQASGTQTSFPMLVAGTYSYLATTGNGGKVQNSSGFDVGFYADSGLTSKLNWETELYTALDGTVVYWVNVSSLQDGTVIYMAYGDSSISTDQSNAIGTWNANFLGVWHFPNGTALTLNDSTSNTNNLSGTNTPTAGVGQIDGGMNLASASTQYTTTPSNTALTPASLTASTWVKFTSLTPAYTAVISKSNSVNAGYSLFVKSNGKLANYTMNINVDGTGSHTLVTGTWYYLTFTYSAATGIHTYVNASLDDSNSPGNAIPSFTEVFLVGFDNHTAGRALNGSIDEVHVSTGVLSTAWITTEYNNQLAPANFYTIGNETATSIIWNIAFV